MSSIRAQGENVYIPPLNLLKIGLVAPFERILIPKTYERLNNMIMIVLYAPFLLAIALYESKVVTPIMIKLSKKQYT